MATHGKLNVDVFIEPSFQENGFLLSCEGDETCWLVDPGLPSLQTTGMIEAIRERKLKLEKVLLTHGHADHIAGVDILRSEFDGVEVVCPRGEEHMLTDANANLSAPFGFPVTFTPAERIVEVGDELTLATLNWRILDVAGHSPAGVAYYCADADVALVGDSVFAESIGRYDLPGSSREKLLANIRDNILTLPDETFIYSGHGPAATIGQIKESNRVLRWELGQQ